METIGKSENIPDIDELRKKIDVCNEKIFRDLAERMALIPQVAEYKKANNIPRYQPAREKVVIEKARELALELNINPDLAEGIMKLIIADAHRIEEKIIGE